MCPKLPQPYTPPVGVYVALLRGINVGGKGKLAMSDLRDICERTGFDCAKTYIQSGNVAFKSSLPERQVKAKLEKALTTRMGRPAVALVRTPAELRAAIRRNPFKEAAPRQLLVLFLDEAPPKNALDRLRIPGREKVELAGRELFIHYPDGMGHSKLAHPLFDIGTGRNLNTVEKLATMAEELAISSER